MSELGRIDMHMTIGGFSFDMLDKEIREVVDALEGAGWRVYGRDEEDYSYKENIVYTRIIAYKEIKEE